MIDFILGLVIGANLGILAVTILICGRSGDK